MVECKAKRFFNDNDSSDDGFQPKTNTSFYNSQAGIHLKSKTTLDAEDTYQKNRRCDDYDDYFLNEPSDYEDDITLCPVKKTRLPKVSTTALPATNGSYSTVARKMMERMGYKEGMGLGKHGQGRTEIVPTSKQRGRRGLGLEVEGLEPNANITWTHAQKVILEENITWLPECSSSPPVLEIMQGGHTRSIQQVKWPCTEPKLTVCGGTEMDRCYCCGSEDLTVFLSSPKSTTPRYLAEARSYREAPTPNGVGKRVGRAVCVQSPVQNPSSGKSDVKSESMASLNERDFVLEVIDKYRQEPCLWQVANRDYHDKIKRNHALDNMLELFKTRNPYSSRETVQRKLSSIRRLYNKELRKVKASLTTGSDPGSIYVPKLWFFSHLSFLRDQYIPQNSWNTLSILDYPPFEEEENEDPFVDNGSSSSQNSSSSRSPLCVKRSKAEAGKVLEKIVKPKQQHASFGDYVAEKLRSMPTTMVPYCQKIINDAIFLGEMQSLGISTRIIIDQSPSTSNRHPLMMASNTAVESTDTDSDFESV